MAPMLPTAGPSTDQMLPSSWQRCVINGRQVACTIWSLHSSMLARLLYGSLWGGIGSSMAMPFPPVVPFLAFLPFRPLLPFLPFLPSRPLSPFPAFSPPLRFPPFFSSQPFLPFLPPCLPMQVPLLPFPPSFLLLLPPFRPSLPS